MENRSQEFAWHQTMAGLIEAIDRPSFWSLLIKTLNDHVAFDSWVALMFAPSEPPVVLAEQPTEDGSEDALFQDYLKGLYLLDPFYVALESHAKSGLVRLDEVAPERFHFTEYYQRYFRLNIVADEIQFNQPLDRERTLCLSLGSANRFSQQDIAFLAMIQPWVTAFIRQRYVFEQQNLTKVDTVKPESKYDMPLPSDSVFHASLTARELDVSQFILAGHSNKGIAQKLSISVETVKAHKKHIYTKLGINSQSQLFSVFLQAQQQQMHQNQAQTGWESEIPERPSWLVAIR